MSPHEAFVPFKIIFLSIISSCNYRNAVSCISTSISTNMDIVKKKLTLQIKSYANNRMMGLLTLCSVAPVNLKQC